MSRRTILVGGLALIAAALVGFGWRLNSGTPGARAPQPVARTQVASRYEVESIPRTGRPPADGRLRSTAQLQADVIRAAQAWRETQTEDAATRDRLVAETTAVISNRDVAVLGAALSDSDFNTAVGVALVERWLRLDPLAAAIWLSDRGALAETETQLAAQALDQDPLVLEAYSDQLPASPWKEAVLRAAALDLAERDPSAAIAAARRMAPGENRTDVLQSVAYAWMVHAPAQAASWIGSEGDSGLRAALEVSAAQAIGLSDPDLARQWAGTGGR